MPTLRRYYEGKASVADIERSMWATGDSKLRGLQRRRAEERAGVRSALMGDNSFSSTLPFNTSEEYPLFTPMNTLSSYSVPEVTLPVDEPLVDAAMEYAYTKEALERQERQDRLNAFNMLMGMSNPYPTSNSNSLMGTIGMLTGNQYGNGGNLFDGTSQQSQQINTPKPNIFRRPDGSYFYQEGPEDKEINVTPMNTVFDNPSQWTYVDDEGRQYTPKQPFANNTGEITKGEDSNPLVKAANNYFRELAYRSTYDPSSIALQGKYTMPAIAASALLPVAGEAVAGTSIAGIPTMTWADTALTAGFAGHGLNHTINEGIDGWRDAAMTALEVAPLGRLAKPVHEGIVQPGMRLFNSPLTGNWTKIGNREYRLSPNSLGVNGSPLESRAITPQITAENAASITPEQWTATQDAAIARGDMAEAQRLRDLHFKVSAPNTQIVDKTGEPLHLYHGTNSKFNAFDESLYGSTDGGMYGTGVYTTPYKGYAEMYGDNIMDLYSNISNPVDARNLSLDDLMLGKLEEGNN